jgi:hypothetical protein
MSLRIASALVVAATLLTGAAEAAFAGKQTVTLDRPAIVGETMLPAGTYRIDLFAGPDTARFFQGKHAVAEARYRVELARALFDGDELHYLAEDSGRDRLIKIVFATSGLAIEFPTEGVSTAPRSGYEAGELRGGAGRR